MTFDQILDRDVPTIVAHSRALARMGVCAPLTIFYKHEAIGALSDAASFQEMDGWTPTQYSIGAGLPYSGYYAFIRKIAEKLPLFA